MLVLVFRDIKDAAAAPIYSYSDVSASCIRSSNAYISRDSKTDDIMKKIFESQMQFSKWTTILGILCLMQID